MEKQYQLSRRGRMAWLVALVSLPLVAAGAVFGLTDDSLDEGENSPLAQRYTTVTNSDADASRLGRPDGKRTLVLYDGPGTASKDGEVYSIAAGNVAKHFGAGKVAVVGDYTADMMKDFDAVVYVGKDSAATPPKAFLADVLKGSVPVLWVEKNIDDLVGYAPDSIALFVSRYGWDPTAPLKVSDDQAKYVSYKGRSLGRSTLDSDAVYSPRIVEPGKALTLATIVCGDPESPHACEVEGEPTMTGLAWAVRSGNLTYLTEMPVNDIDNNDLYQIFSDLYDDLLRAR